MSSEKLKITVYRDPGMNGAYTWSPFVAKLETRLRLAQLPYSVTEGSFSEAPKGKLPYVRFGEEKEAVSDSTLIARTLIETGLVEDLNADLSAEKKAMDLAMRALLEDKLYYMTVSMNASELEHVKN